MWLLGYEGPAHVNTGDKVEINQIVTPACNMLGSETDLAIIF